ncbi:MAG: hemolysin III family protein, partial [Bifidobacteriaceae bacterium]|nr:hemolysin III family protein [Bifidobacteriaceae bacterium]
MDEKKSISKDGTKPAKKAASVVKSGTKSATKSTKPATKSVAKTVAKSTAKPAAKSTKPATKSAAKSTKTVATSAATSAANQAKPAAKKPSKNLPTERTLLRGWFHAGFTPLVLALGVVLITLAAVLPESNTHKLLASIEFMVCSTILFSMSAIYNIFNWGPRTKMVLRRIDHVNIFLIIAGTYSPIAVSCMPWVNPDSVFFSGRTLLI